MQKQPSEGFFKKRLWHLCFPVSFAKFLRTPFLTKHLWWLPLNRCDCQQWISYSASKKYLLPQKFRNSHHRCSVKEGLLLEKGSSIAKVLRSLTLKNICERLLLKISVSVIFKSSRPEMFCKKDALRNLAKFKVKHPC